MALLHHQFHASHRDPAQPALVLIHGLFGDLHNLGVLARPLSERFAVLQPDLRNHGLSPREPAMNYPLMAQDIVALLDHYQLEQVIAIGHSMGGKVAMQLSALIPDRLQAVVSLDMAPVAYHERRHDAVFAALEAVSRAGIQRRDEAARCMRQWLEDENVIAFLLKSFHQGKWRFAVPTLKAHYAEIIGWTPLPRWPRPALFIRGGNSPWLSDQYRSAVLEQFPNARLHHIANAGHWVHAEQPASVLRAIQRFLTALPPHDATDGATPPVTD